MRLQNLVTYSWLDDTIEEATGERQERSARPLRNVLLSKRKRGEMYLYARLDLNYNLNYNII